MTGLEKRLFPGSPVRWPTSATLARTADKKVRARDANLGPSVAAATREEESHETPSSTTAPQPAIRSSPPRSSSSATRRTRILTARAPSGSPRTTAPTTAAASRSTRSRARCGSVPAYRAPCSGAWWPRPVAPACPTASKGRSRATASSEAACATARSEPVRPGFTGRARRSIKPACRPSPRSA